MNHIAIIPARSGSKGIRNKNIRMLAGKPLLQYTIEAAKTSGIFNCIHVSTDSPQYADIAKNCGAEVPFLRHENLSTDMADTWDVIRFVIGQYQLLGKEFDLITVLQPTSPLRSAQDVYNACCLFKEKNAKSVVSVSKTEYSPLLVGILKDSLSLNGFIDLKKIGRRQDMPEYYRVNGAIYMIQPSVLYRITDLYGDKSFAYVMPEERSIDIDTMLDFQMAEMMLTKL